MEIKDFKYNLISGLKHNNIKINIDEKKLELLYKYMKFILEKNKFINLTSIIDEDEFIYKHYIDSLYLVKYIKEGDLIDIGTGGGFPGMPLLIALDNINVTFLDSKKKKLKVIEEFVKENDILRASFLHSRAEVIQKASQLNKDFDYAVTRAVSNIEQVISYSIPFLKETGIGLAMRGFIDIKDQRIIDNNKRIKEVERYQIKDIKNNIIYNRAILILR